MLLFVYRNIYDVFIIRIIARSKLAPLRRRRAMRISSSEDNCWPIENLKLSYNFSVTSSGVIIAPTLHDPDKNVARVSAQPGSAPRSNQPDGAAA